MRRLARQTTTVLAVAALALFLWKLRASFLTLALAVVLAASLEPLIRGEIRHRVPRWLAITSIYLAAALTLGGAALLLGALLPEEVRRISGGVQNGLSLLHSRWPSTLPPLPASLDVIGDDLGRVLLAASSTVFGALFHLCLALVLSLCWSLGAHSIEQTWLSLLPTQGRRRTREMWRGGLEAAGRQIRVEAAQSLLALVLLAAIFSALRMPYATVAALLIALVRMVPWFGTAASVLLAGGVASSLPQGLSAALATLVLLLGLARALDRGSNRPPRLIAGLVLLSLFEVLGPLGLLLAPVLTAVVAALTAEWFRRSAFRDALPEDDSLHARLARLQERLKVEEPSPQVASLVHRLDALLDTEQVLE